MTGLESSAAAHPNIRIHGHGLRFFRDPCGAFDLAIIVDSMQATHATECEETVDQMARVVYAGGDALIVEINRSRDEVRELEGLLDRNAV